MTRPIGMTAIGLVACALSPRSTTQAGEVLDPVMSKRVLVMSTNPEYPSQSSLDENNEFVGFDIDVGKEIAERLGVEIDLVTPGWDVITAGNWAGCCDVSVGSITPMAARREVLDFPAVCYPTPAALVVHTDNTSITEPADANGRTVGVCVAATYENYLCRFIRGSGLGADGGQPRVFQARPG